MAVLDLHIPLTSPDPLSLTIPTCPPRVVTELVTPLLSSQEEHACNGEQEMELRHQDYTRRRPVSDFNLLITLQVSTDVYSD